MAHAPLEVLVLRDTIRDSVRVICSSRAARSMIVEDEAGALSVK